MNEIPLDKIVSLVVKEVVRELSRKGVKVVDSNGFTASPLSSSNDQPSGFRTKVEKIDMSIYKTPLLTESHINKLHELTGEIIVPKGTIISPKASEAIRAKMIKVNYET